MSRSKVCSGIAAGGFALAAILVMTGSKPPADSARREIASVTRRDLLTKVTVAGTILPHKRTVFTPPYNGYIRRLFVKIGEDVKAGAPVMSLSQTPRGNDEEYPLRAPFAGTVVQVMKAEGEYVEIKTENNTIVRIDDLSRLFIVSEVPESDIGKIRVGQEVLVKANAVLDRSYQGIIREIALAAKEKKEWSRSGDRVEFDVRVEIVDKDKQIRPGMSAVIDIITDRRDNVLALQHEYVEKNGDAYQVTLENGEKKKIEVGGQNEEVFEIRAGLSEGEKVRMVDFFTLPST